jgi:hypothetical protein
MHKLTLFPTGNADCCRVDLTNGQKLLFDYADMRCADDAEDKRIDLKAALRRDLKSAKRSNYDVVAFTHLDNDHICGSSDFFEFSHDKKYQGGDRIAISDLWVPAFALTEKAEDCGEEALLIQKEARYRLKQGKGVRIFSRPDALKQWMASNDVDFEEVQHLITDAGQLVPGFNTTDHGLELFVHSPFGSRQNDGTFVDRNTNSLVFQVTFVVDDVQTKLILAADSTHDVWTEIVKLTRAKEREARLEWDIFKLPHHCSYKALSSERGEEKTVPVEAVKWLFEEQAQDAGIVVSTSWPIPAKDADDDDDQPPHRQAANYQRDIKSERNGQFLVTMEHPRASAPEELIIKIDELKATVEKRATGAAAIVSGRALRAG